MAAAVGDRSKEHGGIERVVLPRAAFVLGLYVVAASVWGLSGVGSEEARTRISDVLPLPLEIAAVVCLAAVARRSTEGRERKAWWLLTAGLACYGLGDLSWAVIEVGFGKDPFPSVADAGYLLYYPLVAVSLLLFARRPLRHEGPRLRIALDVATVVLGGFIVVYYLFLGPTIQATQPSTLAKALSIGYPVGDIVLLFALVTLFLRGASTVSTTTLEILVASQAAFFAADLGFGWESSVDSYRPGSWIDCTWLLALALVVLAARSQRLPARPTPGSERRRAAAQARLPYVALVVGYGVVFWVAAREVPFSPVGGLLACAAALTGVVILRQIGAARENALLLVAMGELARTDPLTGLMNRRRFYEVAPEVLESSRAAAEPCALLMIDVDRFKSINDDLGHATGDEAISRIGAVCRELVPPGTVVARYGGDEIIALLPRTDRPFALAHAERIQREVNRIRLAADPVRTLTLSIGLAALQPGDDVDSLAGRADVALLEAKQSGRARVLDAG